MKSSTDNHRGWLLIWSTKVLPKIKARFPWDHDTYCNLQVFESTPWPFLWCLQQNNLIANANYEKIIWPDRFKDTTWNISAIKCLKTTGHVLDFCLAVNLQHPKQSLSLEESVILLKETVRIICFFSPEAVSSGESSDYASESEGGSQRTWCEGNLKAWPRPWTFRPRSCQIDFQLQRWPHAGVDSNYHDPMQRCDITVMRLLFLLFWLREPLRQKLNILSLSHHSMKSA